MVSGINGNGNIKTVTLTGLPNTQSIGDKICIKTLPDGKIMGTAFSSLSEEDVIKALGAVYTLTSEVKFNKGVEGGHAFSFTGKPIATEKQGATPPKAKGPSCIKVGKICVPIVTDSVSLSPAATQTEVEIKSYKTTPDGIEEAISSLNLKEQSGLGSGDVDILFTIGKNGKVSNVSVYSRGNYSGNENDLRDMIANILGKLEFEKPNSEVGPIRLPVRLRPRG